MKKALAFDIGGTKIYSTLIDETGNILSDIDKFSTPNTLEGIKSVLLTQADKYKNEADVIAIATAGAVNNANTAVIGSTGNLPDGYNSLDFQSLSSKKVFLENDANAAAWAEYKIGAPKGTDISVMLTLGTGVDEHSPEMETFMADVSTIDSVLFASITKFDNEEGEKPSEEEIEELKAHVEDKAVDVDDDACEVDDEACEVDEDSPEIEYDEELVKAAQEIEIESAE